jgi:hypothetical protein
MPPFRGDLPRRGCARCVKAATGHCPARERQSKGGPRRSQKDAPRPWQQEPPPPPIAAGQHRLLLRRHTCGFSRAEMRGEHEAVRVIGPDRVRVASGWHNLNRVTDPPVRSDRVHTYEVGAVGRPEKKSAATIKRDVWKSFRPASLWRQASAPPSPDQYHSCMPGMASNARLR